MSSRDRLKPDSVSKAAAGATYRDLDGRLQVVQPKCDWPDSTNGHWVCITHPKDRAMNAFRNQLQKDIHIGRGTHVLAWWCAQHGRPEVP
jgi:hypothetical protein